MPPSQLIPHPLLADSHFLFVVYLEELEMCTCGKFHIDQFFTPICRN